MQADFMTYRARHAEARMRRHRIDRADYDRISSLLEPVVRPVKARKDQFLQQVGERATAIFWIAEGVARNGLSTPDGLEVTLRFAVEGEHANAHEDLLTLDDQHSRIYFIAAETPVLAFALDWEDIRRLRAAHPEMERHYQRSLEHIVERSARQEQARLAALSAEDKLAQFRLDYPGLEARIRQKTLAAYLGITPAYLSMMLKREAKPT